MKKLIILCSFLISVNTAFADCSRNGMGFFPEAGNISLNSMFIIQGYASSQETILSFKERKVYLESEEGALFELGLQEILKGEMYLTQAIFKLIKPLEPHTKYSIRYSDQTEKEEREMYEMNYETLEKEKIFWQTTGAETSALLSSDLSILFKESSVRFYGCGPEAYLKFDVEKKSTSEIWVKTEVVDVTNKTTTVFYIREWDGELNVGHNMCGGAFTFRNKGNYKVRFTAMNTDGAALETTEWQTYESPFMSLD